MSVLDILRQNQQFYSDYDQGIVSGNRLPLLPDEDVMYGTGVIPDIDYSVSPQNGDEDEEDLDLLRFQNMDLQPGYLDRAGSYPSTNFNFNQPNFFERMLNKASDFYGSSKNLIGQGIGTLANFVTGNPIVGGIMSLISRMQAPPSEIAFNRMMQQGYGPQLSSIYGRGGIMQGYNPVSMFGRTPLESMLNRRNKILARKEAGKPYGESVLNRLNQAISSVGGEGGGAGSFDTSAADKAGTSLGSGQFSPSTSRGRSGY